ncbi:MAG: hypothetical protein EBR02_00845 [Alphaproteobacteria bacterium]|jgi:hypothetical protein|nr:hypothetical protein [Alphaproteobacteria bacterium]
MTFETDFLGFARDSIETYGAAVTLRKPGTETYDTTTGNLIQPNTEYNVRGLIEDYSEFHVSQGLVKAGDRRIILAAGSLSVTPAPGDTILFAGQSFLIIGVHSEYAADTPIIHTLQVRN